MTDFKTTLARLMEGATPRPWTQIWNDHYTELVIPWDGETSVDKYCRSVASTHFEKGPANAALIAYLANNAAAILALVEAGERSLDWLSSYPGGGTLGDKGPYDQMRNALARLTGESHD